MTRRASAAASSVQLEVGMDGSSRPLGRPEPVCEGDRSIDGLGGHEGA